MMGGFNLFHIWSHTMSDTPEQPASAPKGDTELVRSGYAIRKPIAAGLPDLLNALGLRSVGRLLTMLVAHRDEAIAALLPIAEKHNKPQNTRVLKSQFFEMVKDMDPEELKKLMERATQGKTD